MLDELIKNPIVKAHYSGKVRDILDLGGTLLIITSDRISAFDVVFPSIIKGKGIILNQISAFFFKNTKHIIQNHFITDNLDEMPVELQPFHEYLKDRCMLVKKTRVIPFECICRGYMSGSAWAEYDKTKTIGGIPIGESLKQSQKFHTTMFTPSTKASEKLSTDKSVVHDENISYNAMCERMDLNLAEKIKNTSIALYEYAHDFFMTRGIILADTKFEFGTLNDEIYLVDEIFTPDSSRFWDNEEYQTSIHRLQDFSPKSYDKQFIRDYVLKIGWDKQPPAPTLPKDIVQKTIEKYSVLADCILKV